MIKISDLFKTDLSHSVLCWLATVSPDGQPNVSPKEIFTLADDTTLLVADIMSPITVTNIASNPQVCLSFVDVFRMKGFKVTGHAVIIPSSAPEFAELGRDLLALAGPDFPIRNLIRIRIDHIAPIKAPSYAIFPNRSEAERMDSAFKTYGVRPVEA